MPGGRRVTHGHFIHPSVVTRPGASVYQVKSAFLEQHTQYFQVWGSLVLEIETTGSPGSTLSPGPGAVQSPALFQVSSAWEASGDRAACACLTLLLWLQQLLIIPACTSCLVVAAR